MGPVRLDRNEAALLAARQGAEAVGLNDFTSAIRARGRACLCSCLLLRYSNGDGASAPASENQRCAKFPGRASYRAAVCAHRFCRLRRCGINYPIGVVHAPRHWVPNQLS